MALPIVASAAVAAFSYLSLKSGQPRPVPMPSEPRTGNSRDYVPKGGAEAALPARQPSKPLTVDRPIIGDRIGDPKFDDVAASTLSTFPRSGPTIVIGAAADSTEKVAGRFLAGRHAGAEHVQVVDLPKASRASAFVTTAAKEAADMLRKARSGTNRHSHHHHSKTTTTTTTTKVVKKGKEGGSSHWIELALLCVAAAVLLTRPRAVQKIKRVYNYATEEDTARGRSSSSKKKSSRRGRGQGSTKPEVVDLTHGAGEVVVTDNAAKGTPAAEGVQNAGAGAGDDAGAQRGDVFFLQNQVQLWQSRHEEDTTELKQQLTQLLAEVKHAREAASKWQEVASDDVGEDVTDESDVGALQRRVRKLQRLVQLLQQQASVASSSAGRRLFGDDNLEGLDQKQLRRKMDETMALIKGEVITLDWPGIELVSRLVSEMGGGWQLRGDGNLMKEETFRECHRLLHLMVEDLEGDQVEGEPWVIENMDEFLDKIDSARYPDVFLTLQRLVVAYDTMGPTAKDSVSAREMVVNAGTLLEVARFTKYWITRIHQHRSHYSTRFGAASGTMRGDDMAASFDSGVASDYSAEPDARAAAMQRLERTVNDTHMHTDTTEHKHEDDVYQDEHHTVHTVTDYTRNEVVDTNAGMRSSDEFSQISAAEAAGVSASGRVTHPRLDDDDA